MRRGSSVLTAALMAASAVAAQEPPERAVGRTSDTVVAAQDVTRANQLLGTIMSPFCPGLTLATCPSPNAESLRVAVRERLAAGEHPDTIMESLVAAFGEEVRGAPKPRGLGLLLWALPVVALAVAALGLAWWLRRHATPGPIPSEGGGPPPAPVTPDEAARLEAERRLVE